LLTVAEQNKVILTEEIKHQLVQLLTLSKFDKQKLRFCNNLLNRYLFIKFLKKGFLGFLEFSQQEMNKYMI